MFFRYLFCFGMLALLAGCKNGDPSKTDEKQPATQQPPAQQQTTTQTVPHPTLPQEIRQDIYDRCDFVDFIFYDPSIPISISLNEPGSIRMTMSHVGTSAASTTGTCKPTGRVVFQSDGEIMQEADFYMGPGCVYYVFMKDGKPAYANNMTQAGVNFFANNINSAKQSLLKGQPGAQ